MLCAKHIGAGGRAAKGCLIGPGFQTEALPTGRWRTARKSRRVSCSISTRKAACSASRRCPRAKPWPRARSPGCSPRPDADRRRPPAGEEERRRLGERITGLEAELAATRAQAARQGGRGCDPCFAGGRGHDARRARELDLWCGWHRGRLVGFPECRERRRQGNDLWQFLHGLSGAKLPPEAQRPVRDRMEMLKPTTEQELIRQLQARFGNSRRQRRWRTRRLTARTGSEGARRDERGAAEEPIPGQDC
jgi:hypothetical protein